MGLLNLKRIQDFGNPYDLLLFLKFISEPQLVGLLLTLCSGLAPGGASGPCALRGLEFGLATCVALTWIPGLSLQSDDLLSKFKEIEIVSKI